MGQRAGKATGSHGGSEKRGGRRLAHTASDGGTGGRTVGAPMLPADLERSLRHLDDADLDRLVDAATAEARRRGRQAGKTSGGKGRAAGVRGKPAPVTAGQEKLILAAFEAGLKPAAIAREFRLSRAQVDGVLASAGQDRR